MSSEQQMSESQGNQRNNSRRLGRGLDALLGTGGKKEVSEPEIGVDAADEVEKSSLSLFVSMGLSSPLLSVRVPVMDMFLLQARGAYKLLSGQDLQMYL